MSDYLSEMIKLAYENSKEELEAFASSMSAVRKNKADGIKKIIAENDRIEAASIADFERQLAEESDREWRATIAAVQMIIPGFRFEL